MSKRPGVGRFGPMEFMLKRHKVERPINYQISVFGDFHGTPFFVLLLSEFGRDTVKFELSLCANRPHWTLFNFCI